MLVDTIEKVRESLRQIQEDLGIIDLLNNDNEDNTTITNSSCIIDSSIHNNSFDLLSLSSSSSNWNCDNCLFCDYEGVNLCRDGKICTGQFSTTKNTFIWDILIMGESIFNEKINNISMKDILESKKIIKILFDPRSDCDALFYQYSIKMNNVLCIQLMEIANRRMNGIEATYNRGLISIINGYDDIKNIISYYFKNNNNDDNDDDFIINDIINIKNKGKNIFKEDMTIWEKRPMNDDLIKYSLLDVKVLIPIYNYFFKKITKNNDYWLKLVIENSIKRIRVYEDKNYNPKSRKNIYAPPF